MKWTAQTKLVGLELWNARHHPNLNSTPHPAYGIISRGVAPDF
jgi:hypothetical protein